jgi:hypothetical protein
MQHDSENRARVEGEELPGFRVHSGGGRKKEEEKRQEAHNDFDDLRLFHGNTPSAESTGTIYRELLYTGIPINLTL